MNATAPRGGRTALVALAPAHAQAALKVFACEPEWGALAQELGGDKVDVYVATSAKQDPHHIEARPSLIARARAADMVVCTGAELEVGWLPAVQRQSANRKIQPGAPGDFEAAFSQIRIEPFRACANHFKLQVLWPNLK